MPPGPTDERPALDDDKVRLGRFMANIMAIIFVVEAAIMVVFAVLPPLPDVTSTLLDATTLTVVGGTVAWLRIGRPFRNALVARSAEVERTRAELLAQARARKTDASIMRALDMADTEDEIVGVAQISLGSAGPEHRGELLLADSSHAHLRRVADSPDGGGPCCSVDTPTGCPAVRRGHPLTFASSLDIDSCPRLRDRPDGPVSAVCVPIAVLGRAAGVIHVTGSVNHPPTPEHVERMGLLGAGVGSRLGMIRSLRDTALAASTDPLTGLLNRRSLEVKMTPLERGGLTYAVIALDLDHFKQLNDTHGHLTGDQALRLFSRVLRSTARDGDLVARFGGEEFLVVLPDTGGIDAAQLAERIRIELAHALAEGAVPQFTVSAGVADADESDTFAEVALLADQRLYLAKAAGRDRVEPAPRSIRSVPGVGAAPAGSGPLREVLTDDDSTCPPATG